MRVPHTITLDNVLKDWFLIPENSRIRVLNIKPKFKQGIDLKPGKYLIEVSAKGYETKEIWANVKAGEDKKIIISIKKKISQIPEAKSPGPAQKPILNKYDIKENKKNDTDILNPNSDIEFGN